MTTGLTDRVVGAPGKAVRVERVNATRSLILAAAERLFAEHGVAAVSDRQVSEAAGQGNNAAVGYHFGTKADLVRAVMRRHTAEIERLRLRLVARIVDSGQIRDWVRCLIQPVTDHLAALGNPTWFARFAAQAMTDPAYRQSIAEESLAVPSLRATLDGLNRCLSEMPADVRAERGAMAGHLMVHMCAERERALAEGTATPARDLSLLAREMSLLARELALPAGEMSLPVLG